MKKHGGRRDYFMGELDVLKLLAAAGPYPPDADKLMLYGRLVGTWDVESTWHQAGVQTHGTGTWVFGWVLGGRGVQDVLFASGAAPEQYGTSLRCYDAATDAWHIARMQLASGEFVHLVGRQVGDLVVQEGINSVASRRERWTFSEITRDSFRWTGGVSFDAGATWLVEQEMGGRRRAG
jgi:hypothetical protein